MKRLLIIFLVLSVHATINAQGVKSIGIKSGVSISNQSWQSKLYDLPTASGGRTGLYFSGSLEFLNSKYISLITDIGYSQKGMKEEVLFTVADLPEGSFLSYYDTKFNYVTLSPMLKAKYETDHLIPYVLLGLRLDYELSHKYGFYHYQVTEDTHKAIFGLSSGAGIEYKIKNIGFSAEFQYQHDFTHVLDISSTSNNTGLEVKNKAIIANIGIRYYLHKKENTQ